MTPVPWRVDGLAICGRRVREVDCVAGGIRARVRGSARRVVVEFVAADALARAAAHRLAAHVLEQAAAADGWLLADPVVRGASVVITGAHAAETARSFFAGAADAALVRPRRRLASGTRGAA